MKLNTTSAVISLGKELENESSKLYTELAKKYTRDEEFFSKAIKENKKFVADVERAYYEVITDAIEGCYAFNMESDTYKVDADSVMQTSDSDKLAVAVEEFENRIIKFYLDAAEHSGSLMADVPRAFTLVAKKREKRLEQMKSLLNSV